MADLPRTSPTTMTYELDASPGYLYEKMADHLAARIGSGELAPHTPLPPEGRRAQEYGVSLGTARHATRLLRHRGLVVIVQSKGTYVATRPTAPPHPLGTAG